MNRKDYIKPTIRVKTVESESALLAASDIVSNEGIGGGDKDTDGTVSPQSKINYHYGSSSSVWDEEEEW